MKGSNGINRRHVLGAGVALPLGALASAAGATGKCAPDDIPLFQFNIAIARS